MEAAGTLTDHAGGGFNDGDMLQPPNTLLTVLKPGLAPEESMSQFKLWYGNFDVMCVVDVVRNSVLSGVWHCQMWRHRMHTMCPKPVGDHAHPVPVGCCTLVLRPDSRL